MLVLNSNLGLIIAKSLRKHKCTIFLKAWQLTASKTRSRSDFLLAVFPWQQFGFAMTVQNVRLWLCLTRNEGRILQAWKSGWVGLQIKCTCTSHSTGWIFPLCVRFSHQVLLTVGFSFFHMRAETAYGKSEIDFGPQRQKSPTTTSTPPHRLPSRVSFSSYPSNIYYENYATCHPLCNLSVADLGALWQSPLCMSFGVLTVLGSRLGHLATILPKKLALMLWHCHLSRTRWWLTSQVFEKVVVLDFGNGWFTCLCHAKSQDCWCF